MGVRVKVKIIVNGRSVITSALINSRFETDSPDICIPMELACHLGLWPSDKVGIIGDFYCRQRDNRLYFR